MQDKLTRLQIDAPWNFDADSVLGHLEVSPDTGLTKGEVERRRETYGPNLLRKVKSKSAWFILLDNFKGITTLLLVLAAAVSFAFGEYVECAAIVTVIVINAALGFFIELNAVRSMEALRKLGSVNTRVRRDGYIREVSSADLVPGDIVVIEGGDVVTADLRLFQTSKLQADESTLTGESIPVSKQTGTVQDDAGIFERTNMLYKGTSLTRGSGEGVVTSTGMDTELGRITSLIEEAEQEQTPLQIRLDKLGKELVWLTILIAAVVAALGIFRQREVFLMIQTSIALAVAAIPEGLPIVATIALARGMLRMAKRNALINRLAAVETLGATNIIFSDKTGTLTENVLTLQRIAVHSGEVIISGEGFKIKGEFTRNGKTIFASDDKTLKLALEIGVLCNNASLSREVDEDNDLKTTGDPLEVALLVAGAKAGIYREELTARMPELREVAFDPENKMMATYHKRNGRRFVAVKGAPEAVLETCTHFITKDGARKLTREDIESLNEINHAMAESGLRILSVASKEVDNIVEEPYERLGFVGILGLLDPPRSDVRDAIAACKKAGIKVIMVTGDQPATALNIGVTVGLVQDSFERVVQGNELDDIDAMTDDEFAKLEEVPIFARVSPKQKLDLIGGYQKRGYIVAMTGDGVNDAPALKRADIGIAMGKRGTQVAREASDMILKDDAFSTIVVTVEQGRIIFDNIRKFVFYLLSCNVSEVMIVFLASVFNMPLPLLPLQILFLNLITDVFPALALGVGEGSTETMKKRPRDTRESILTKSHWLSIIVYGSIITLCVLGALASALYFLKLDEIGAVSVSFLTLAFAQLWHVFNMREAGSTIFKNDITRNPYVWGALILCSALLISAIYVPGISNILKLTNPGLKGWILALIMSIIPIGAGQLIKSLKSYRLA